MIGRLIAIACAFCLGGLFHTAAGADETEGEPAASPYRFHLRAGWPEGITYEVGKLTPGLAGAGPLSHFEDIYLTGRIGARLDLDAAAFAADSSLDDFDGGFAVRRARFYLLGNFRLGLPLAYKFEFSVEGERVLLNDFYGRLTPGRWVDSIDIGYLTPPMGLENVVSSRSLTCMEIASPVQALAPGFRSGVAVAGHWAPWRTAWKVGVFSAGQEQISGDASETSAQIVGRAAWLPWRESSAAGESLVHLGLSLSYITSGDSGIQYRARPESFIAPFTVDTGDTAGDKAFLYGVEAAWTDGPRLLSGELLQSNVFAEGGADSQVYGLYGLFSWILTGEDHPYDAATGMFERVIPDRPVKSRDGGPGAWEIGQRLSWLDLSDGGVRGGEMLTLNSGLTWHLNAELKLAVNYVFAHIGDGPQRGDVSIFQARLEIGI